MYMVTCYAPDSSAEFRTFGDVCEAMMEGLDSVFHRGGGLARMETLTKSGDAWEVGTDRGVVIVRPATEKENAETTAWNAQQDEREAKAKRDAESIRRSYRRRR
jgi:hypothetical protein